MISLTSNSQSCACVMVYAWQQTPCLLWSNHATADPTSGDTTSLSIAITKERSKFHKCISTSVCRMYREEILDCTTLGLLSIMDKL